MVGKTYTNILYDLLFIFAGLSLINLYRSFYNQQNRTTYSLPCLNTTINALLSSFAVAWPLFPSFLMLGSLIIYYGFETVLDACYQSYTEDLVLFGDLVGW